MREAFLDRRKGMSDLKRIIGRENVVTQLQKVIESKQPSHAYLFCGPEGVGKEFIAKIFAEALLCEVDNSPCGSCASCRKVMNKNHIDVRYILPSKGNFLGVDEIRKGLVEDIINKPYEGAYKIYMIPNAHQMTPQASNALLKTLEEPPSYGVIILLAENLESILPTIQSRCMVININPLPEKEIEKYLIEKENLPDFQAKRIAIFARGSIGKALRLAHNQDFIELLGKTVYLLKNIKNKPYYDLVSDMKELERDQGQINDILDIMTVWFRDILLFKATTNPDRILFVDDIVDIRKQASQGSYEGLEIIIESIEKARLRLEAHANFEQTLDLLLESIKTNL